MGDASLADDDLTLEQGKGAQMGVDLSDTEHLALLLIVDLNTVETHVALDDADVDTVDADAGLQFLCQHVRSPCENFVLKRWTANDKDCYGCQNDNDGDSSSNNADGPKDNLVHKIRLFGCKYTTFL
jgi:hypothetical protein